MTRARLRARVHLFWSGVSFGLMAAVVRLASRPGGFDGPQLLAVRMAVGTAMTLALFRLRPGTFRPRNVRLLVTRGLLGGLAALLYFMTLERIPAGEAALLNTAFPLFATVFSFFTLGERPTVHIGVGLAVATAGMVLVVGNGGLPARLGAGEVIGIVSAVVGGGAVASIRALRATDNAPTIFLAFTLGGLAVSLPLSGGAWPGQAWIWAAGLVVGVLSFAAQLLMTEAYGALTVAEAAVWQQLIPVATYLWAFALLGERLSVAGMAGVGLGIAGVVYATVLGHRASPRPVPADDGARTLVP